MDFANERYVRLYVRDTITWNRLGWDGQNALTQLLRKADRSGVIDLGGIEPWEALVVLCHAPEDAARRGVARVLELECVVQDGDRLVFPRYIEANETPQSDAQRQRESRAKRATVTKRDDSQSQNVTECHGESRGVTDGHNLSLRAVPCRTEPADPTVRELPAHAHEEQSSGQDRESDKRRGNDWMLQATVKHWQGYDHELGLIGAKSDEERAAALVGFQRDAWCQANITKCSPKYVLRKWHDLAAGAPPMQLAKASTSDTQLWRSRVQASTKLLEELRARRQQLQRSDQNFLSISYDLDKQITEESERLERRKRELHALTG